MSINLTGSQYLASTPLTNVAHFEVSMGGMYYPTSISGTQTFFTISDNTTNTDVFALWLNSFNTLHLLAGATTQTVTVSSLVNSWHQLAASYNDVNHIAKLYLDGTLILSFTYSGNIVNSVNRVITFGGDIYTSTNAITKLVSPFYFTAELPSSSFMAYLSMDSSFIGTEDDLYSFWQLSTVTDLSDQLSQNNLNIYGTGASTSFDPVNYVYPQVAESITSKQTKTNSLLNGYEMRAYIGPYKYQGWDENNVYKGSNYQINYIDWIDISSFCTGKLDIKHTLESTQATLTGINFDGSIMVSDRSVLIKVHFYDAATKTWGLWHDYYLGYIIKGTITVDWHSNDWSFDLEGDYYYLNQTNAQDYTFGNLNVAKGKSASATSELALYEAEKQTEGFIGTDVTAKMSTDGNLSTTWISDGVPQVPTVQPVSKPYPKINQTMWPRTSAEDWTHSQWFEFMAYNNLCVSRGGPDQVSGLHYTSFDLRDFGADLDGSGHDFEWYHDNVWIHPSAGSIHYVPGGLRNDDGAGHHIYSFETITDWNEASRKCVLTNSSPHPVTGRIRGPVWFWFSDRGVWPDGPGNHSSGASDNGSDLDGNSSDYPTPTAWQTGDYDENCEIWYNVWVKANLPTDNKIWYFEVESEGNGGHSSSVQNEIATGEWQQLTWRVMNPTGPYKSPSGRGRHHFHDDTPRFSIQMHDGENHTGYINVAASFYVGWQEVVGGFGDAFKTDFWRQGEIAISIVDASDVEQYYIDFRALNVPQLGGAKRIVLCDDKTLYTAEFGNEKPESQIIEVKDYLPNLFLDHTQGWKIKLKRNAEYDYITRTHLAIVEPEHIYDVVTINSMTIPSPDVDLTYGLYNNTYDSKYPDNYTYGYGRFVGTLRSEGDGHFGVNAYPCPGEGSLGEREAVMVDLGEIAPLYLDGQLLTSDDIIHIKDASITYGAQGVIAIGTEMIAFNQNSQDTLSGWNIDNNQKTGCARGYNGTTPSTHEQNDPVYPCLQDAFGNWYIQQYPNIVAIGWARPEGHSYPERYKIIYSYTHNDTPWTGSPPFPSASSFENATDWLDSGVNTGGIHNGSTWVNVGGNRNYYRVHFKGNTDNNPPTWPPPEDYYAGSNLAGTQMRAFCIIVEQMRPLGRAKISEIVAYSKNASGSTEGHYASRFCPDIKGILGYYYVSVFAPVYAGTPVEYMTRFHTESAQMPLSIGITAHYGDMVVAKGKIASIMQNIASKVGFRVFVDRWNHLWVLPDIDHEGLWHAESDFTFDESNTYKVTITKEPAWKLAQVNVKAVDVQKNNFTASYPQFPYPRGEVKEYNDQLIGTQTEAEALAHMEFAEGNRGYTVSLVCGMADWLERGMKVKLNLANIDTNGTTFQNKGFLVNTWEESIAFGSPDWTTTIDLIEAKVF